jgi:3-deoxy-D-manno-octulosonate 8-phosphate phosphatase KdsC-like HAD superfamily phosphatase
MGSLRMTPLIVDLDHTLIDTDLLYESSMGALKKNPLLIFIYPFWFLRGKGYLKEQLTKRFSIDVSALAYNQSVIDYIKKRKKQGDKIILATASHKLYAFAVSNHLKIEKTQAKNKQQDFNLFTHNDQQTTVKKIDLFDDVMASNKNFNLSSHNKAEKLIEHFGDKGFDYMGDHMRDLPVWEASNLSILVNVSNKIINKTKHLNTLVLSRKH